MEIKEVLTEWEAFKVRFQKVLDDFNNNVGAYDYSGLLERANTLKEFHGKIQNIHEFLAVADLIVELAADPFSEMLDKCAFERGWNKNNREINWKDDADKLVAVHYYAIKPRKDYSDLVPFEYENIVQDGGMGRLYSAGHPLIIIEKDDQDQFTANLNDEVQITRQIRLIEDESRKWR